MTEQPKQPSRAPKRMALNMKVTPDVRARVEAAAKESGLSIAQEVERRVLSSIENDDHYGRAFNARFVRLIGNRIATIEEHLGKSWTHDTAAFFAVRGALIAALDEFRPAAEGSGIANLIAIGTGQMIAEQFGDTSAQQDEANGA